MTPRAAILLFLVMALFVIYVTGWVVIPILTPNPDGNHGELYVPIKMLTVPFYCFTLSVLVYLMTMICKNRKK